MPGLTFKRSASPVNWLNCFVPPRQRRVGIGLQRGGVIPPLSDERT